MQNPWCLPGSGRKKRIVRTTHFLVNNFARGQGARAACPPAKVPKTIATHSVYQHVQTSDVITGDSRPKFATTSNTPKANSAATVAKRIQSAGEIKNPRHAWPTFRKMQGVAAKCISTSASPMHKCNLAGNGKAKINHRDHADQRLENKPNSRFCSRQGSRDNRNK
jgi:hypothetical protein